MEKCMRWSFVLAAGLAVLPACTGGGKIATAPVSGKVTVQGKAIEGAQVTFFKEGAPRSATGITDSQGVYQLSTFGQNDGAVLGENQVTIAMGSKNLGNISADNPGADYGEAMKSAASGKLATKEGVPAKYANPATSGLTREVKSGKNEFNFDLEP